MLDRRKNLTRRDFIHEYLIPLRPVIIEDSVRHWKARDWTPEWFKATHGNKLVRVEDQPTRLGDFIDEVRASSEQRPARYLRNVDVPTAFPELLADVSPEMPYAMPDRLRTRLLPKHFPQESHFLDLFIGGPGSGFPYLHYDVHHLLSYLTQIYGEKEFLLFAPDQGKYLYPDVETPDHSTVETPMTPDYAKFPLFKQAQATRFTLEPGDTLFMPCGWWHTTRMLSVSITLGYDQLCAANWRAFLGDQYARRRDESPLKSKAVLAYLIGVGAALSFKERVSGVWPRLPDLDVVAQVQEARKFEL